GQLITIIFPQRAFGLAILLLIFFMGPHATGLSATCCCTIRNLYFDLLRNENDTIIDSPVFPILNAIRVISMNSGSS
ncbi:MAG: hypothetical protein ACRD8W_20200, partial [Nitrososphaeraceae archaeon]